MNTRHVAINGVIPAPLSMFDSERNFDYDTFARQIDYFASEGADGVFIGGTTAEGAYLTAEERLQAIETVVRTAGDTLQIFAVVLRAATHLVVAELDALSRTPVAAVSAVTPFYYALDQTEIEIHYRAIADRSPLPLVLYNIPQNTKNRLRVETTAKLAAHPNIVGIKDSSGDFMAFSHGLATSGDDFCWIQGEDRLDAPSLLLGARAIVTGLGNVDIRPYIELRDAVRHGDRETALHCQQRINELARIIAIADGKVVQAIKSATALTGRATHHMRIAAMDLRPDTVEALSAWADAQSS